MHLEINYSKMNNWSIYIYRRNCGEEETDIKIIEIVNVLDYDMELCFAKAQVQFKEWLLENNGGY